MLDTLRLVGLVLGVILVHILALGSLYMVYARFVEILKKKVTYKFEHFFGLIFYVLGSVLFNWILYGWYLGEGINF